MTNPDKEKQENEGEGSRSAARAYNKHQQAFVKEGRVKDAAAAARQAIEDGHPDLDQAEKQGEARAAEHDPEEKRDDKTPT
ncbi:MAG: hypothetical protein K9G30_09420 [Parvibaculum sp.]|nr:hypothetical protein [Parvibaculum sp.]